MKGMLIYDFAYPNKPSNGDEECLIIFRDHIPKKKTRFQKKWECKGEKATTYVHIVRVKTQERASERTLLQSPKISKVFTFPK